MRALSSEGIPFSFSFFTYDRDKKIGHGLRHISRATPRATPQEYIIENASHKLFYSFSGSIPRGLPRGLFAVLLHGKIGFQFG